ncbi:class II glutamine amidotransferase, partial [Neisseria gonorrhoeae]
MCQLLGMNCNTPTDIMFSFEGFRRRGGITDHHADGFGIGFFEGKGVRLFHDDKPSA